MEKLRFFTAFITGRKITVHNNCKVTFRNPTWKKKSEKKRFPAIIQDEAMEG